MMVLVGKQAVFPFSQGGWIALSTVKSMLSVEPQSFVHTQGICKIKKTA
jgi:hypothetical protein